MNNIEVFTEQDRIVNEWKHFTTLIRPYRKKWKEQIEDYEVITRKNIDNIITVLPITKDNKIVVIEEFRIPINDTVIWSPAWLCDKQWETIEDAARRELYEETWYKPWKMIPAFRTPTSSGMTDEVIDCYIATECEKVTDILTLDNAEDIRVMEIDMRNFNDFIMNYIARWWLVDSKMLGMIWYYNDNNNWQ